METSVCIYGATAGGVAAAVQAARMGASVVLLESSEHLGGMTSGGLGATDIGNKQAIGGIAREFYQRVARHYSGEEAWYRQSREDYFRSPRRSSDTMDASGERRATMWTFEPHVAKSILFEMLNGAKVPVYFRQSLISVKKEGNRLREILMGNGRLYRADIFIDASYEGDLMARAGVSYTVGREANRVYDETLNGIREKTPKHQFAVNVDPYLEPGRPASGCVPLVQEGGLGQPGEGDFSVQAYNFRLCYTRVKSNQLPHAAPANYSPAQYELLARYLEALVAAGRTPKLREFWNPTPMPNGKTDANNNGPLSTDFIGHNYAYPEGDYAAREAIWREHKDYTQGLFYFLSSDSRVPASLQKEVRDWGPARDEFAESGNWPPQLYVREARRMVSDTVMSEHHCRGTVQVADSVGLAAYTMDSHNCRRIVRNGRAENEGDVQVGGFPPYPVGYGAMVPKGRECRNLLVPICLSASHIAYGSIRMEPVFMILGQSAATAGVMALERRCAVQEVDYASLRAKLLADGQVLAWK